MCSTLGAQLESTGDKKRPTGHQKISGVRKQPRLLGRDSSRQHAATSGARPPQPRGSGRLGLEMLGALLPAATH